MTTECYHRLHQGLSTQVHSSNPDSCLRCYPLIFQSETVAAVHITRVASSLTWRYILSRALNSSSSSIALRAADMGDKANSFIANMLRRKASDVQSGWTSRKLLSAKSRCSWAHSILMEAFKLDPSSVRGCLNLALYVTLQAGADVV
jgi:hypothetical protein